MWSQCVVVVVAVVDDGLTPNRTAFCVSLVRPGCGPHVIASVSRVEYQGGYPIPPLTWPAALPTTEVGFGSSVVPQNYINDERQELIRTKRLQRSDVLEERAVGASGACYWQFL